MTDPIDFKIDDLFAVVMKAMAFDLIKARLLIPKGILDKITTEVQTHIKSIEKNPRYQHEIASIVTKLAEKLLQ